MDVPLETFLVVVVLLGRITYCNMCIGFLLKYVTKVRDIIATHCVLDPFKMNPKATPPNTEAIVSMVSRLCRKHDSAALFSMLCRLCLLELLIVFRP